MESLKKKRGTKSSCWVVHSRWWMSNESRVCLDNNTEQQRRQQQGDQREHKKGRDVLSSAACWCVDDRTVYDATTRPATIDVLHHQRLVSFSFALWLSHLVYVFVCVCVCGLMYVFIWILCKSDSLNDSLHIGPSFFASSFSLVSLHPFHSILDLL